MKNLVSNCIKARLARLGRSGFNYRDCHGTTRLTMTEMMVKLETEGGQQKAVNSKQ